MLMAFFVTVFLIGFKLIGFITAPWWIIFCACVLNLIIGLFLSGVVKVKVVREER